MHRHWPALVPADEPGPARGPADARPGAWCLMTDGTWQLVHVGAWHPGAGAQWRCLLRWGSWGTVYEGWYTCDPGKLIPAARPRQDG